MRPALAALAAPALVLAAYLVAWGNGEPHAVRRAWSPWLAPLLALGGVLGPTLLARGTLSRETARGVVLAALAALGVLAVLVVLAPLGPGETTQSRAFPAVDAVAGGALVGLAALARGRWWPVVTLALGAALVARAVGLVASARAVDLLGAGVLAAALFWSAAALLAASLAAARLMLRRRATRG